MNTARFSSVSEWSLETEGSSNYHLGEAAILFLSRDLAEAAGPEDKVGLGISSEWELRDFQPFVQ